MATGGRRRGRVFIFIALILILLVVLAWAVMRFLNLLPGQVNPQAAMTPVAPIEETVSIVISVQPISRGAEFNESIVTTVPYPKKDLVEGSFMTDIKEVIGKRAKTDLDARTPITQSMLVDANMKNSPAAFQIPKGQVAITVPVSKLSSVAYGLQTGDHVNVIASLLLVDIDPAFQSKLPNMTGLVIAPGPSEKGPTAASASIQKGDGTYGRTELDPTLGQPVYVIPSEPQRPRLVSQTLIQDAVVLQSGTFALPTDAAAAAQPTPVPAAGAAATPAAPAAPDVITLVVSPQDAITLNYLMLSGARLNLVMRSAGDTERVTTNAVTMQFIMDQYNIPNPAKLPYSMEPRMDAFPFGVNAFPSTGSSIQAAPAQ